MHHVLNRNLFLVKEHVGFFKAANNFDIYDPQTKEQILLCREERLGIFTKLLRFTDYKRFTPFDIEVTHAQRRAHAARPPRHLDLPLESRSCSTATNTARVIGGFKQKLFSIGGAFTVLDSHDQPICDLKGKWTGWDFRFMAGDTRTGPRHQKMVRHRQGNVHHRRQLHPRNLRHVPPDSQIRQLILAAVLCIDMVLKE